MTRRRSSPSRVGLARFRVAGTAEFNSANKDIRAERIETLISWRRMHFPGMSPRQAIPWAGLRPMMPDMMLRVMRGRNPRVFHNTGHGHLGWTLSRLRRPMPLPLWRQAQATPPKTLLYS
jgi:D-amino-acid dehydrogenase